MINEIYINEKLIVTDSHRKKFKNGYKIKCICCNKFVERKYYDKKILDSPYECKSCVLKNKNPMHNSDIKSKHNKIVKSKEYRQHMSSLLSGENNPFYNKTHTSESIEKIKKANKSYWDNLTNEKRENISKRCSDIQKKLLKDNPKDYRRKRSKAARLSHMSQFDNCDMNKIEKIVSEYFDENKLDFIYSVILASYQFDFKIKGDKILIEVNGDYWHGNPEFYNKDGLFGKRKLNKIQLSKMEKDIEKTKWAESRGFTLIRIWESEIKNGNYKNKLNEIKKNSKN